MQLPTFTVKPGAVALMALMAATRFHHFGSALTLPDASLAVFFLAGLWLGGRYLFAILLLEAGLIDYLAIAEMGVSDYCISPAYVFLIPTYAVMWLGGQWCGRQVGLALPGIATRLAVLVSSTSLAFLISNGSFFLLSENNTDSSWAHFVDSFALYYPPYLNATVLYAVGIFAVVTLAQALFFGKAGRQAV